MLGDWNFSVLDEAPMRVTVNNNIPPPAKAKASDKEHKRWSMLTEHVIQIQQIQRTRYRMRRYGRCRSPVARSGAAADPDGKTDLELTLAIQTTDTKERKS